MRWVLIGVGVLMVLVGGIWLFQGIGMLLGSFMSRQPFWAIVGGGVLIVGMVLLLAGIRRGASKPS